MTSVLYKNNPSVRSFKQPCTINRKNTESSISLDAQYLATGKIQKLLALDLQNPSNAQVG